jgi:uncharacterized protein
MTATNETMTRNKVHFASGDAHCAAWHLPGANGACVIMAGGLGVTKEPGTDRFARRFNEAGFTVLAFDFRRLGESGGAPRQVVRVRDQLEDWEAAIALHARCPRSTPPGSSSGASRSRAGRCSTWPRAIPS